MSASAGWSPTPDGRPTRPRARAVLGWGGLCLTASVGAASSGGSGLLGLASLYVFVVAVVALIRGRVLWARLRGRAAGGAALGVAAALAFAAGASAEPSAPPPVDARSAVAAPTSAPSTRPSVSETHSATPAAGPTASATASATTSPSADPAPAPASPAKAVRGTALAALATLAVKGRAPKTGYSRDEFGQAWFDTDRNGCDTRNDMLRRDLTDRDMKNWCKVLAGTRSPDPYTGTTIHFLIGGASEIDIDHVVALSDAWQKGAARWPAGKRLAFANDPLALLAVDAGANRSKGDGDAATWLPPNRSYRCQYVARQVAVKVKYDLWVTAAERDAMVRVLSACPGTRVPAPGTAPTVAALPRSRSTSPTAPPASTTNYANCTAVRAAGAAPLRSADPGYSRTLDRDGDGVACE